MQICNFPGYRDHWSKDELIGLIFSEVMSLWKFEQILSFLHVGPADATNKEKIQDLIDYINERSMYHYYPGTYVTIDERMISFRGNFYFPGCSEYGVYDRCKPTKWGFRPYLLADHKFGYTYYMRLLEDLQDGENCKMHELIMIMI